MLGLKIIHPFIINPNTNPIQPDQPTSPIYLLYMDTLKIASYQRDA